MFAAPDARAASALALAMSMAALLLAALHAGFAALVSALHRHGVFAETVVVVGATDAAARLAVRAKRTGAAHIVAVVDDRRAQAQWRDDLPPLCGNIDDLLAWSGLSEVDRIVVAVPPTSPASVRAILKRLRCAPNRIDLLLEDGDAELHAPGARRIAGVLAVSAAGRGDDHRHALFRRAADLAFGGALLLVLAAPMAAIALAIKLDSAGPALYRQRRIGKNGRAFTAYKFRTMHWMPDAPWRPASANQQRVTRIGKKLRLRHIDDWPMLFNVVRGEMSLVGPRPHAADANAAGCTLRQIAADYPARHCVKPGMFGWAQINGWRETPRTPACVRAHLKHDLDYIEHASIWLDLQLLVRALFSAFRGR
jgi:lipopolysaccharide/colanic/teichoic acid biosynthesis glycosyltransferase